MRDKYLKDFVHYFMLHFPYSVHEVRQQGRKKAAKQPKVDASRGVHSCGVML